MIASIGLIRHSSFWAAGCLMVGIGVFSFQDLILKLISGEYPVHQAMMIRSVVAMPLLLLMVAAEGGIRRIFPPRSPALLLRSIINLVCYAAYYLGLAALPFATLVALFFTAPLFIAAMSALFLKEPVSPKQWAAVVIGFIGVVIMVRPGTGVFDWAMALPLCAGIAYAVVQIITRRIGTREGPATMAAYSNAVFAIGAGALAGVFGTGEFANEQHASLGFLLRGWVAPSSIDLILMMLCGVIAAIGLMLLSEAYRSAPASQLAPFEYSALGWSVLYGWLIWNEVPDLLAWLGIAIILGAGLYVLTAQREPGAPARSIAAPSRPPRSGA
jgi:drug/metabolite transporter (DMT)-like permease